MIEVRGQKVQRWSAILGAIQEVVQGFRIVKAFRLEAALGKGVDKSIDNLERASNNLAKVANG